MKGRGKERNSTLNNTLLHKIFAIKKKIAKLKCREHYMRRKFSHSHDVNNEEKMSEFITTATFRKSYFLIYSEPMSWSFSSLLFFV